MSTYTFLGPAGTFTEAALLQVPGAREARRVPAATVPLALASVSEGEADAAMVPIENSVEGGVSATLDAIAGAEDLWIVGEYLVPITFALAVRPGTALEQVEAVSTHGHAWAQVSSWIAAHLPGAHYLPGSSTAAAAAELAGAPSAEAVPFQAAVCSPATVQALGLEALAESIGNVPDAVTRFVLVARRESLPEPTGQDKTSVVVPLPDDHPGALMDILTQFSSRGVNLNRIESRPTGEGMGSYFFSIDVDGHLHDERVGAALKGLHRFTDVRFLGSYPRADKADSSAAAAQHTDEAYIRAQQWFEGLLPR